MIIQQKQSFKLINALELVIQGNSEDDFIVIENGVKNIQVKRNKIDELIEMLKWVKENENK